MTRLKLAMQKDGRMTTGSRALLAAAGFDFEFRDRMLITACRNFALDVLSVRDDDIPEYVQEGVSDLGIVGENTLIEKGAKVDVLEKLGFAHCRLAICAPKGVADVAELRGQRIATSYPRTLARYLAARGIDAEIVELSGSVEVAPKLNLAEAICDLVSSGGTARLNGLEVLDTVLESEAVLIGKPGLIDGAGRGALEAMLLRLRSSLAARGKRYVMMNAPAQAVPTIKELIPTMRSPTIVPLVDPSFVAIHSVIGENLFWEIIDRLKSVGARDIVVVPIERIVP